MDDLEVRKILPIIVATLIIGITIGGGITTAKPNHKENKRNNGF